MDPKDSVIKGLPCNTNEPPHKTDKMTCTPSDDSDEPGHSPSLIRVFAIRMKKLPIECLAMSLIRLGGCPVFAGQWAHSQILAFVRVRLKLFCMNMFNI